MMGKENNIFNIRQILISIFLLDNELENFERNKPTKNNNGGIK